MGLVRTLLGFAKIQFSEENVYRLDSFIWMLLVPAFFLVEYFLWRAIFSVSTQEIIRGFTFSGIVIYFFLSHIVQAVTSCRVDSEISRSVKNGKFIKHLVRPINFLTYSFIRNCWRAVFRVKFLPILLIIGYFTIPSFEYTSLNLLFFIITVIFAITIRFSFTFLFGLISFWTKEYWGIKSIRQGIHMFFAGSVIPLTFFPSSLQTISKYMPFQYMLYVPIQTFLGTYSTVEVMNLILVQVIWTAAFFGMSLLVWKKAHTRFMGVGV
ncbi:hypothetical protein HOD83_02275 [Candidatus Woesearchaeota archaeon]|jgi:ABC-2 type transport system permease protein|nr:hypothetical protein [Candidatus Woesearchaeota archaeon]MBT4114165.1 hypothetical protein [Candidatus Woesearchaeota archaeon]MBT4248392.1 hypothetical protein [Candidatus Woesearchaeota archaeon]